jgi:DNA-binding NtrC family response regulator
MAASSAEGIELSRFLSDRALRIRALSTERWGEDCATEIAGFSQPILDLQAKLEKAARYHEPVLITGESGVGKDLLAQSVYLLGCPNGRPYISVNCPQHQDANLTVSELFGHKKGSFTGAIADRKGAFEEADGGLIFLDEVSDLHLTAQAMLLRTLQTGEFKPLGATHPRSADVRVVAATNQSLNALVATKQFRYDLLFRLWYFHLVVPPLRERGGDWHVILEYLLLKLARRYGIAKRMSTASLDLLRGYQWPGNIRQLISVATIGYAMADGDVIEPNDFAPELSKPQHPGGDAPGYAPAFAVGSVHKAATQAPAPSATGEIGVELYGHIAQSGGDFWALVYQPFMERDLNRDQVRSMIKAGLAQSGGNYRRLVDALRLMPGEYQRFMDFLRHHNLKP